LLVEFTRRDFLERYSGSVLGVAWSFIWPLVSLFIYIAIFSKVMSAKLPGVSSAYSYGIYLVAGLVPWTAFCNTVARSATVFVDKKSIISKIHISLPRLPLYIVMSESVTFVISMALYLAFLMATGNPLHPTALLLPFVYLVHQVLAYSLGFVVATLLVFLRDLREVTGIVLQIWFWFTPIVYVVDIVPDFVRGFFVYNPAYLFVKAYQDVLVFNRAPDIDSLMILAVLGHVLLAVGYVLFKRLEKDVRDFV